GRRSEADGDGNAVTEEHRAAGRASSSRPGGNREGEDPRSDAARAGSRPSTPDREGEAAGQQIADDVTSPARSGGAAESTAARRTREVERIRDLARQIVDAVRVGTDRARRQVVMVDAEVPGRGQVRIRLRRDGESFETRMRADSEELARTLRRNEDTLRESAREDDVLFSSIDIVT
ncbi:MAG: hypothetical protein ABEN55_19065, partial [Bradymonadaceae bacterium]